MALVAGQILHAADLAALGLSSRLDVDSAAVNNSTVLVSTALVIAIAANSVYGLDSNIIFDAAAAADCKWNMLLPAGASISFANWGNDTGSATFNGPIAHDYVYGATGSVAGTQAVGSPMSQRITGVVRTAATAGNMTFQFAQQTANVSNALVRKDSWMRVFLL